jgi:hypothetical protein
MFEFHGKTRSKEATRKTRHRWEDNIKMDLREIRWGCVEWIDLVQDRDQWEGCHEHVNEPSGSIKCW